MSNDNNDAATTPAPEPPKQHIPSQAFVDFAVQSAKAVALAEENAKSLLGLAQAVRETAIKNIRDQRATGGEPDPAELAAILTMVVEKIAQETGELIGSILAVAGGRFDFIVLEGTEGTFDAKYMERPESEQ